MRLARSIATSSSSAMVSRARSRCSGTSRTAGRPAGFDRRHVGAGSLDPQDLDLFAEKVAGVCLERSIAAAMQDQLAVAAEQPCRIEPQAPDRARRRLWRNARLSSRRQLRPTGFSWRVDRLHQPPAMRRDHQPLRRGRSVLSLSPTSVTTGSGAGGAGCVGGGCGASLAVTAGAGSRTVERRRGGSG